MLGPILRGEKISLEPTQPEDLPLFVEWLSNPEITRTLAMRFPPSLKAEEGWYEGVAGGEDHVVWVIKVEGRTVGNTGIHGIDHVNRRAETGLMIGDRSAWGKGYASEAVSLRTRFAFEELNLERLGSQSLVENLAMHRALEKSGYQKIGRMRRYLFKGGQWHDVYVFEVLRDEWQEAQR